MRFLLRKIIPNYLLHYYRLWKYPSYKEKYQQNEEIERLKLAPRFQEGKVSFLGKHLKFIDNASFFFMKDEIFNKQIYRFKTDNETPTILDVGSNIGLSIIYFKKLYPTAKVIGFEPDKRVFHLLEGNIKNYQLSNVELHCKGAWKEDTMLRFYSEGADGGRILRQKEKGDIYEIETVSLRSYLSQPIAMLKIDIEGAEVEVLKNCADLLFNVDNIFVEYHSFTEKPQDLYIILNILQEAGFRYQIHHVGIYSPQPYIKINSNMGMDLQLNIFGVRKK